MKDISDYESVFIPYGADWTPEKIMYLFEKRRNSAIAERINNPNVEKPFKYKPPFVYSNYIADVLGRYDQDEYRDRAPEKASLPHRIFGYFSGVAPLPVMDEAFRIVSSLPKKIFWREVDPTTQISGSFHPLKGDWYRDALISGTDPALPHSPPSTSPSFPSKDIPSHSPAHPIPPHQFHIPHSSSHDD